MLTRRALSARELGDRLQGKGFDPAEVRTEVRRLRRTGLLDDRRLAAAILQQQLLKGRGRRHLTLELRRRGVSAAVAVAALADLPASAEDASLAATLSRARRRHPGPLRSGSVRQKVARYLLSRGFATEAVRAALADAAAEDESESSSEESNFPGDPLADSPDAGRM